VWQYQALRAFEIADERRTEADRWRLARSVPRRQRPNPVRRAFARIAAATSRASGDLAVALDRQAFGDRRGRVVGLGERMPDGERR